MRPTAPSDHWLDWFSEDPSSSSSSRPAPQRSTMTSPHIENNTPADSTVRPRQQHCDHGDEGGNNSSLETTSLPRYSNPHHDHERDRLPPSQQQSTSRSRWRWSTWSTMNPWTLSRRKKGKNQRSNPTGASTERNRRNRHSWLDQHKRRTYPPRALRVLKQEQKRLTQRKGGKKSKMYRLIGASYSSNSNSIGNTNQKQRDAFFQPPVRRRRHSLTGVLTSFVHSNSSLSPPSSSSNTDQSGVQSGSGGGDESSSSSSRFRRTALPSYLSLQQNPSSSRKSVKATPTVRSSMVIQYADDDNDNDELTSMHLPDIVYRGNNDQSKSTLGSSSGKSISSRRRQKQRLKFSHQEGSSSNNNNGNNNWFSNWILHHPRRRQRRRNEKRNQHKRHANLVKAINNNGSSSKIHPSPSTTTNSTPSTGDDNEKKNMMDLKKTLPLLRHATLSDLSSLSSSNPSHLFKSSNPPTLNRPQTTLPPSYRFSVFWKSSSGKSGKRVIHVDERGNVGPATLCTQWKTCNHEKSASILAILFITGFLICPLWWVGAFLYLTKSSWFDKDLEAVYLWTPRTFGHLNCWMSIFSLLLLGLLVALVIWYHLVIV